MNVLVSNEQRADRLAICQICEHLRLEGNRWFCAKCDCPPLQIKARYKLAKCPIGKW